MNIFQNRIVPGYNGKPMSVDISLRADGLPKPLVIYAHGFNGFKGWGNFNIIADQFRDAGFVFVQFNFSHNGTIPEHPQEFVDLEAYANNNYTIQLHDLGCIINCCSDPQQIDRYQIDATRLYLLGHSLGGGIVLLKAATDNRVAKVTTWAAVNACTTPWGNWSTEKMEEWKHAGVAYTTNTRTKQQMPLNYQLFLNHQHHAEQLNIQSAIQQLNIPILLCHGSNDEAVPIDKAHQLHQWQPAAKLFVVESDHVFGRKHPWTAPDLPLPMQQVVDQTIQFFQQ